MGLPGDAPLIPSAADSAEVILPGKLCRGELDRVSCSGENFLAVSLIFLSLGALSWYVCLSSLVGSCKSP